MFSVVSQVPHLPIRLTARSLTTRSSEQRLAVGSSSAFRLSVPRQPLSLSLESLGHHLMTFPDLCWPLAMRRRSPLVTGCLQHRFRIRSEYPTMRVGLVPLWRFVCASFAALAIHFLVQGPASVHSFFRLAALGCTKAVRLLTTSRFRGRWRTSTRLAPLCSEPGFALFLCNRYVFRPLASVAELGSVIDLQESKDGPPKSD